MSSGRLRLSGRNELSASGGGSVPVYAWALPSGDTFFVARGAVDSSFTALGSWRTNNWMPALPSPDRHPDYMSSWPVVLSTWSGIGPSCRSPVVDVPDGSNMRIEPPGDDGLCSVPFGTTNVSPCRKVTVVSLPSASRMATSNWPSKTRKNSCRGDVNGSSGHGVIVTATRATHSATTWPRTASGKDP
jgi:hypothetical protein